LTMRPSLFVKLSLPFNTRSPHMFLFVAFLSFLFLRSLLLHYHLPDARLSIAFLFPPCDLVLPQRLCLLQKGDGLFLLYFQYHRPPLQVCGSPLRFHGLRLRRIRELALEFSRDFEAVETSVSPNDRPVRGVCVGWGRKAFCSPNLPSQAHSGPPALIRE